VLQTPPQQHLGRRSSGVLSYSPHYLVGQVSQAARIENVDALTARQRLPRVDRARAQYVRRLYCVSIDDPELYQLQIDSTAVPLDICAGLIVAAYRSFVQAQPVGA
jgi:cytidylate kinase